MVEATSRSQASNQLAADYLRVLVVCTFDHPGKKTEFEIFRSAEVYLNHCSAISRNSGRNKTPGATGGELRKASSNKAAMPRICSRRDVHDI